MNLIYHQGADLSIPASAMKNGVFAPVKRMAAGKRALAESNRHRSPERPENVQTIPAQCRESRLL